THLHFDHCGGTTRMDDLGRIVATYPRARVHVSRAQLDACAAPNALEKDSFSTEHIDAIRHAGLLSPIDTFETVPVTKYLSEGDTVRFGQSELQVLATPGHSPGSLSFYASQDGFVLSGDALFEGSIGRTDLWGGDLRTLITAIREKLLTLPDATVVYSGHGPATTVGIEKNENPYL
ncbi:hypothetical protein T235_08810, partial [Tannerella sp. oral taxon BU063 isolate Cell 8/11]